MDNKKEIDHEELAKSITSSILASLKEKNMLDMDSEIHKSHHEFIELIKKREERHLQLREKIIETVAGSATLSFITALIGAIGYAVVTYIKQIKSGQ